ncbi:TMV resistance protein N-like [Dorcoceras hygrometricum]|uniref:TMV resistance protein N-like n=1 Tax=Dorcoceras hygrometricum TaxID=472368 RepID=A0A2Z7CPJ4_9LAMI|nr:TMV resistance protein N-like [Dorcoceras hygrometricum]
MSAGKSSLATFHSLHLHAKVFNLLLALYEASYDGGHIYIQRYLIKQHTVLKQCNYDGGGVEMPESGEDILSPY